MIWKFNDMAESLESEFSNENFTVFVSGVCSTEEDVKNSSEDGEGITKTKVDKKDYEKILELKTEDIAEKTVSDFLNIYVEKVQSEEFQNIQNKVFRSITENNIPTYLSDEDLDFLTITLEATSSEFIALYHEKSEKNVIEYSIDSISDDSNNDKYNFFMNYEVTYTMSDSTKILIKDRDAGIRAIKEGAESYIKDKTKDELMHGGMKDLKNFLDEIAENNSNNDIKFSILISSYKIE